MSKDFLDNAIEEHDEYERENKKIESEKFFSNLKERKQKNTVHDLDKIYDNCLSMLNKYKITGQIESMKKIIFIIDCIEKEKRLVDLGFDCYIYRQDIEENKVDFSQMPKGWKTPKLAKCKRISARKSQMIFRKCL